MLRARATKEQKTVQIRNLSHLCGKSCFIGLASIMGTGMSGCISAEAEIPETKVTRQNLSFPSVPPGVPTIVPEDATPEFLAQLGIDESGEFQLPVVSFSYDEPPADMPEGLTSDMHVKTVTVSAHDAALNLSFVRRLTLTVRNLDKNGGAPQVLIEYSNTGALDTVIQNSLTVPVEGLDDVVNPWKAQAGIYELTIWGDVEKLPREPWAVDVSLTFSGSVSFEF